MVGTTPGITDKPAMNVQPDLFTRHATPEGIPSDVAVLFERFTKETIAAGMTRYSADAVLHRIRWFHHVERGDREFKCNDHWSAVLARWFLARYPQHHGFFELRTRKAKAA